MASLDEFRREVGDFIDANVPDALRGTHLLTEAQVWGGSSEPFRLEGSREWLERCVAKGWAAPLFPTEYGGAGWSKAEAKVWRQELARREVPPPLIGFGLDMIVRDLPAGGVRLLQRADGYDHTFVAGVEIMANGESTGATPGRLVRGAR